MLSDCLMRPTKREIRCDMGTLRHAHRDRAFATGLAERLFQETLHADGASANMQDRPALLALWRRLEPFWAFTSRVG